MIRRFLTVLAALATIATMAVVIHRPSPAAAELSGSQFNPGNIISDRVFYDSTAMTAGQVQTFLNARYNGCSSGYVCIRDYRTSSNSRAAEGGLCNAYTGRSSETAAAIIYNVGRACGVNPQVLLVLLQKESSLITSTSPDYRAPMGYNCPDSSGCDAKYYGFFNQVYGAARSFKYYRLYPHDYNYVAGRSNYIQYNPKTSCGGTNVYIENQATAGLYDYTPYQPNAAALRNLHGTGDGCSAYGNRNFWVFYHTWFTVPPVPAVPAAPYDIGGLAATRPDGTLWFYRGSATAARPYTAPSLIGASSWQSLNRIVAGDVTGDGRADLVGTKPDGTLWEYPNTGTNHAYSGGSRKIGVSGWSQFNRILIADINNDGRADLIMTKPDGSLWLCKNTGSSTRPFSGALRIGASGWNTYTKIALADVDGNGRADLVGTRANGSLWYFANSGNDSRPFNGQRIVGASGWNTFNRIIATDTNVDGRADLVMTRKDGSLWLSANAGGYLPFKGAQKIGASGWDGFDKIFSTVVPVPHRTVSSDLVAAKSNGTLSLFAKQDPPAPFSGSTRIGASGWGSFNLLVPADVNGDGRSDLIARKLNGSLWLYVGTGNATRPYRAGVEIGASGWQQFTHIVAFDVNRDGKDDVVVIRTNGSMWMYASSGSVVTPYRTGVRIGVSGWGAFNRMVVGDVTGDSRSDLLATRPDGTMWLYSGTGSASRPLSGAVKIGAGGWNSYNQILLTTPTVPTPSQPVDLVARQPNGALWLFRNVGSVTRPFSVGQKIGTGGWQQFTKIVPAAINADTQADLVVTKADGSMWLYLNQGAGPIASGRVVGASGWQAFDKIAAADVNRDGRADLVLTKPAGTLWYYRGTGNRSAPYQPGIVIGASGWQGFNAIAAGDLTGDGLADLISIRPSDGSMWMYINRNSATRPYSGALRIGASGWNAFTKVVVGDVTGDGLADLVAIRKSDGTLWLYPNLHNPAHPFSSAIRIGSGGWNAMTRLALTDVNHDGKADLLSTTADGHMRLYTNSGSPNAPFPGRVELRQTSWQSFGLVAI